MKKIKSKFENEYKIWYVEEGNINILKNVINGNFEVKKEFKNSERNYVVEIEIAGKRYLLKDNKSEYRKIFYVLKKFFNDSEGVQILKNQLELEKEGLENFAKILGAVEKRKFGILRKTFFILELIEGKVCSSAIQKDKVIEEVKKLHKLYRYHGDCNPCNFLEEESGNIKMIDTKCKKMFFGNYRAHYDMLTMQMDSYQEMKYPYQKNIFYYLALIIKKLKKIF